MNDESKNVQQRSHEGGGTQPGEDQETLGAEVTRHFRKFGGDVEPHELREIRCAAHGEGGVQENAETDAGQLHMDSDWAEVPKGKSTCGGMMM